MGYREDASDCEVRGTTSEPVTNKVDCGRQNGSRERLSIRRGSRGRRRIQVAFDLCDTTSEDYINKEGPLFRFWRAVGHHLHTQVAASTDGTACSAFINPVTARFCSFLGE